MNPSRHFGCFALAALAMLLASGSAHAGTVTSLGNFIPNGIDGSNIIGSFSTSRNASYLFNGSSYTKIAFPGALQTNATGIADSNIVGYYVDGSGHEHGFIQNGSTYTTLDDPLGAKGTFPYGIDGKTIVGHYFDASGADHGFVYDGTNWTTLDFPGAKATGAGGVSGGNIIGSYTDAGGNGHGFLYNGHAFSTISPPGATYSEADGISGSSIVGLSDGGGFLYSISTGQYSYPLTPQFGTDYWFTGISGSTVIGTDVQFRVGDQGFIATIPEPSSYSLALLGASGLLLLFSEHCS